MTTVGIYSLWHNHTELLANLPLLLETDGWNRYVLIDNGSNEVDRYRFEQWICEYDDSHKGKPLIWLHRENINDCTLSVNAAVAKGNEDIIIYIANDTVRNEEDWISRMLEGIRPGVLQGPILSSQMAIDYIEGWAYAIYREDWEKLGGFDPAYMNPGYWSDVDFSWRAVLGGMTLKQTRGGLGTLGHITTGGPSAPGFWDHFGKNNTIFVERLSKKDQWADTMRRRFA